jgi:hypothetical protein
VELRILRHRENFRRTLKPPLNDGFITAIGANRCPFNHQRFLGGLIHTMNPAICGSENPFGPGGAQDFVLRREASACHYLQGAPDGRTVVVAANL